MILAALLMLSGCTAVDGDTLRCGKDRIRLLGIDAPELHTCRKGRVCVPGDPVASKDSLARMIGRGEVRVEPVTRDRYGRTVAQVYAGRVNVACRQLRKGMAIYQPKWDNGRRLAKECHVP